MKILLIFLALLPLMWAGYTLPSAIDPIKMLSNVTGVGAIVLLLISLLPSTCKRLCHFNFIKYRKTLGLLAFMYTLFHVSAFVILDAELDLTFLIEKSLKKPFIYIGAIAFVILLFMALTSFKKLFAKFSTYHKAVYLALALALFHSFWAQKVAGVFEYSVVAVGVVLLGERVWAWKRA
ncbi:MAG: ferric reductase-like transmembrane domain-containing protein [Sulfurospirillaceae bacterium]|nr:ferric reductase-like transmembrane domain-containing protein [Sulfurospirillaceae bacterium]MDD2825694.1 ferric reductase-like transmembrane domain-containing protein [Sulfurospirillaceae bacterium]